MFTTVAQELWTAEEEKVFRSGTGTGNMPPCLSKREE